MTAAFARSTNHVGHVGPAALIGPDRTAMRGIAPTTTRWAPTVTILETMIPETRGTPSVQLATAAAIAIVVHPVVTLVQTEGTRSETLNVAIGLFIVGQHVPIESCAICAADTGSGNIPNACFGIIVDQSGDLGVAAPLRPGDYLMFNSLVPHCVSSRCNNRDDMIVLSMYMKTSVVGMNNNELEITLLQAILSKRFQSYLSQKLRSPNRQCNVRHQHDTFYKALLLTVIHYRNIFIVFFFQFYLQRNDSNYALVRPQ
jgi:hypothetical protein